MQERVSASSRPIELLPVPGGPARISPARRRTPRFWVAGEVKRRRAKSSRSRRGAGRKSLESSALSRRGARCPLARSLAAAHAVVPLGVVEPELEEPGLGVEVHGPDAEEVLRALVGDADHGALLAAREEEPEVLGHLEPVPLAQAQALELRDGRLFALMTLGDAERPGDLPALLLEVPRQRVPEQGGPELAEQEGVLERPVGAEELGRDPGDQAVGLDEPDELLEGLSSPAVERLAGDRGGAVSRHFRFGDHDRSPLGRSLGSGHLSEDLPVGHSGHERSIAAGDRS